MRLNEGNKVGLARGREPEHILGGERLLTPLMFRPIICPPNVDGSPPPGGGRNAPHDVKEFPLQLSDG